MFLPSLFIISFRRYKIETNYVSSFCKSKGRVLTRREKQPRFQ